MTDDTGATAEKWITKPSRAMTGADGSFALDQSELVVQTLGGPDRRRMQFDASWRWRRLQGEDRQLPAELVDARELATLRLHLMRRAAACDFALGWGAEAGERALDPVWGRLADLGIERTPRRTIIVELSGADLQEIYRRWIAAGQVLADPSPDVSALEAPRRYRVAMQPDLCWKLSEREKNLVSVVPGPEWKPLVLWHQLETGSATTTGPAGR